MPTSLQQGIEQTALPIASAIGTQSWKHWGDGGLDPEIAEKWFDIREAWEDVSSKEDFPADLQG